MRRWLVPALLLVGCSSGTPTAPAVQGQATADLKLNAQKAGSFDCGGGLFFVASITNGTTAPLRVDSLSLAFAKVSGSCSSHPAIDSPVSVMVPVGITSEIRRVDLAGDLCRAPNGPGCEWLAKATLATSYGTLTDEIDFRTTGAEAVTTSGCPVPSLDSPQTGEVISGGLDVRCSLPKKLPRGCDPPYMYFRWNGPNSLAGLMSGGPTYRFFVDTLLVRNGNYGLWCEADYGAQFKMSATVVVKVAN